TVVYKPCLPSHQIKALYLHLQNHAYQSKLPLLHSPFTTNTFPACKPPHPNPILIHNPQINTINPNLNSIPAPQNKL
ncbi:hypothetical protein, partial [Staphylococcus epidermidis]|uniref:hypothetical protein n=1 Tax=Staphylococcus epidermidis TaxID=1282 RepID=UPI0011A93691